MINNTIRDWLLNTDKESREVFVDAIFNLINYNDNDTFKDILNNWIEEIPIVVSNYKNLNNKQRKTINDMLIIFGKSALDNFIHRKN